MDYEVYLYATDPVIAYKAQSFASFTPAGKGNNRYNNADIEISAEDYQKIMADGNDTIYFRYYKSNGNNKGYYIASGSLSDLLDDNAVTLVFSRRY